MNSNHINKKLDGVNSSKMSITYIWCLLMWVRKSPKKSFWFRSNHRRYSIKKGVLRNFAKFTGKHQCQSLFLIKLKASDLQLCLKRDSGTGVFLWILQNSEEHLFYGTTPDDCFCWFHLQLHIDCGYKIAVVLTYQLLIRTAFSILAKWCKNCTMQAS